MEIRTANTIIYCVKWKETAAFYKTKLRLKTTVVFDWFVEFELNETARLSIADVTRTSMETCAGKGITITMKVEDINACHMFPLEESGASSSSNPGPHLGGKSQDEARCHRSILRELLIKRGADVQ